MLKTVTLNEVCAWMLVGIGCFYFWRLGSTQNVRPDSQNVRYRTARMHCCCRTYITVRWLALFQVACHVLYIGWWRAFMSNSLDDIIDNSDWLLAFIFLKLPAVFAAGEMLLWLPQLCC